MYYFDDLPNKYCMDIAIKEMCCFESFYDSGFTKSLEIHIVIINDPFYTSKQFLGLWQSFLLFIHNNTPKSLETQAGGGLMHLGSKEKIKIEVFYIFKYDF